MQIGPPEGGRYEIGERVKAREILADLKREGAGGGGGYRGKRMKINGMADVNEFRVAS